MDENNIAPDSNQGQAIEAQSPSDSGQGLARPEVESGQGEIGTPHDPVHFQRKITELGQEKAKLASELSQYKEQLSGLQPKVERFGKLEQSLQSYFQPTQEVDPVDALMNDPRNFVANTLKGNPELFKEVLSQTPEWQEMQQFKVNQQVGQYIAQEDAKMSQSLNNLVNDGSLAQEHVSQVRSLPTLMSKVQQMQEQAGREFSHEEKQQAVAQEILNAGGIENVLKLEIGNLYMSNPVEFQRAGAINLQQRSYKAKRAAAYNGNFADGNQSTESGSSLAKRVYR